MSICLPLRDLRRQSHGDIRGNSMGRAISVDVRIEAWAQTYGHGHMTTGKNSICDGLVVAYFLPRYWGICEYSKCGSVTLLYIDLVFCEHHLLSKLLTNSGLHHCWDSHVREIWIRSNCWPQPKNGSCPPAFSFHFADTNETFDVYHWRPPGWRWLLPSHQFWALHLGWSPLPNSQLWKCVRINHPFSP